MALVAALSIWDPPSTSKQGALRYQELAQATQIVRDFLYPQDISSADYGGRKAETSEVANAIRYLIDAGKKDEAVNDFLNTVELRFILVRNDVLKSMGSIEEVKDDTARNTEAMVACLERMAAWQRAWGVPLRSFGDPKLISHFTGFFASLLHSSLPKTFPQHFESFLANSLAALPEHLQEPPHHQNAQSLQTVPNQAEKVPPPSVHLSRLGMIPRYSSTLNKVVFAEIERIVAEEAEKGWDARRLARIRQRVGHGIASWLNGIFEGNDAALAALRPMYGRFDYHLCKCLFEIRTSELFDIIVDYPESLPALEDLKDCLFKVDQRSTLVDKLKASNIKRLLHPGADTKDVITQYISTIRCLRFLDPPGVLLHKVADPIRKHLRDRQDTIKCIVATLVEGEELSDENDASAGLISQTNDEAIENFTDPKWEPEPVDAAPEFRSGKASDIVSTLISIYETREVIIKELQVLLATRLLAVKDYDAVKEIRTIELLKIRFGETALQVCDVMLKDVADSKRIKDHVHGDIKSNVHPLVISRMFWPNIQSSSLHLPPKLEAVQREYEAAFHQFKPDKRLRWLQNIGTAHIKLELSDRIVETEATPLQASIAELFEGKDTTWTHRALAEKMNVDGSTVRNACAFWAGLGVLKEEKGIWRILEVAEDMVVPGQAFVEDGPVIESADENPGEQVRVYWNYIKGILTNLGPKPTDAIHGMMAYIEDYDKTVEDLEMFLAGAKREGLVDQKPDGAWLLL